MKMHLLNLDTSTKTIVVRRSSFKRRLQKSGFTLIEILVVLGIIGTLLAIGVGAIKGLTNSKGVSTAVPLAEGVFTQARQIARATGAPARVVIYSNTTGEKEDLSKRYLRMMGVATGRDASGDPVLGGDPVSEWRLISRPITLPRGAYFNESLSTHSGVDTAVFPGGEQSCYVYEFNVEGALIAATSNGSGEALNNGQFVVQAGVFVPTSPPTVDEDSNALRDAGGFRIFRNGRIATFIDPNQIAGEDTPLEF